MRPREEDLGPRGALTSTLHLFGTGLLTWVNTARSLTRNRRDIGLLVHRQRNDFV